MSQFIKIKGRLIVDPQGRPLIFKGVNLGGWLLMEGYFLHAPNAAEQIFKKNFRRALGKEALDSFQQDFRSHFIREEDLKAIAGFGFNCVRVPFHHRLIEKSPYRYDKEGLRYLDQLMGWAHQYNLWIILDLHAACGAQNHDWHSDSLGEALLWKNKEYQRRTFALWEFLADRYQEETAIAGYDLLNEAVVGDARLLNEFYKKLIKTIRGVDRHRLLFVEGNTWATDLACLDELSDDKVVLSIHVYQPTDFTFNSVPSLQYPFTRGGLRWDRVALRKLLSAYAKIATRRSRPIHVGEFGVHVRYGFFGEDQWLKDILACFKELGFHWTYWTYKAIKNSVFPDGVFSYVENPPWVNRQGPRLGWETYSALWREKREDIIRSWETQNFQENTYLLNILKDAARSNNQPPKSTA